MNRSLFAVAASLLMASPGAHAQMPGVPTLQNAWANRGLAAGLNAGTGGSSQVIAAVASWAPQNGRFEISGGAGFHDRDDGGSGGAYGLRGAFPIYSFARGSLGIAGFLGIGGAWLPDAETLTHRGGTMTQVPVGVGVGYRRAFSFVRGASVYATPFYSYNRLTVADSTETENLFRIAFGLDVGITRNIGVTAGVEFGGSSDESEPGPTGSVFGIGASYAFRSR